MSNGQVVPQYEGPAARLLRQDSSNKPLRSHIARGEDSAYPRFEDLTLTQKELTHLSHHNWTTEKRSKDIDIGAFGEILFTHIFSYTGGGFAHVGKKEEAYFHFRLSGSIITLNVAASTLEECNRVIAYALELWPVQKAAPERQQVCFKFWNTGGSGPSSNDRLLDVPRWDQIEQNYSTSTKALLDSMMKMDLAKRSADEPKLLLWSGKPGGGKTFGIRALAWEFRKLANFEYIVDPESLFGDSSYFVEVLLDDEADASKWRVLIMEDTGELLAADAKARTGQGLSRLLNVMDGLIGQGLRIMILITTNEDLGALHPAVTRPGRCASNINFHPLTVAEANAWLTRYECARTVSKPTTLAELFAIRHDEELKTNWENKPGVGFLAEELTVNS